MLEFGMVPEISLNIQKRCTNMSLLYAGSRGANATWSQRLGPANLELHLHFTETGAVGADYSL